MAAQYYDWGSSAASIQWRSMESGDLKIVFPDYFQTQAVRTMGYLEAVSPHIGQGFRRGPMKTPLVLHTQNSVPNGIVMLAPRRMEFIANPGGAAYATPWLKQLSVHEYRHAVQFNSLNSGFFKLFGYLLGEQGWMLGSWGLPLWMMEGDATLAETQFTSYGRGVQPSFTLEYRAMYGEGVARYSADKLFSGSYRDFVPDHYKLGYQMVSYVDTHHDSSMLDKVGRFWTKYPYLIYSKNIALRKYYKTSEKRILAATFDDLESHWATLPVARDNFATIPNKSTSYTTYQSPVLLDNSKTYTVKSDFDRYNRMVELSTTGQESLLFRLGNINTPPVYAEGKFYWTEYRSSKFWQERINSKLCIYDTQTGKKSTVSGLRNVVYPTAIDSGKIAYAKYNYNGTYTVVRGTLEIPLADTVSLHGLAGDPKSGVLYMIGLSDGGMWLGSFSPQGVFSQLTPPTRTTLSGISAADGKVFYSSTASGKDEIHLFDTRTQTDYQITTSKYGSFNPTPSPDGKSVAFVAYANARKGYVVANKVITADSLVATPFSYMPLNTLNPVRRKWEGINIDTLKITDIAPNKAQSKRYRKSAHLINVHSWAPIYYEPLKVIDELAFDLQYGVTLISQDVLSSMVASVGYGHTQSGGNLVGGTIKYNGWAPKFELSATWGGQERRVYGYRLPVEIAPPVADLSNRYFDAKLTCYLPILFDGGYHLRQLVPIVEIGHNNALFLEPDAKGYIAGYQKLTTSLQYSDNVRMAYRDLLPRWGYMVGASFVSTPLDNNFGTIFSGYARGYLPGVAPHHSLSLRGVYQYQTLGFYNFSREELYPRGATYYMLSSHYRATSVNYQLPLCYPDWGINSLVFFKRIRANFGFDYARITPLGRGEDFDVNSYGGDLFFDLTVNRMPAAATSTLKISIYKPSDQQGAYLGFGLTLPI